MTKAKTKAETLFDAPAEAAKPEPAKQERKVSKPSGKNAVAKVELVPATSGNLLVAIANAAADPACQPEKVHALLDARDRLMRQEAHVAFVLAYISMQSDLPTIDATGRIVIDGKPGKRGQSTPYAKYKVIQRVTKPILAEHGFAMMMLPDVGANGVGVAMRGLLSYVCKTQYGRMVHTESCLIAAPLETGGSKNNVQGVGSSLSYTKRYAAIALLDLVSEAPEDVDDDGSGKGTDDDEAIDAKQLQQIVDYAGKIECPAENLLKHLNKTCPEGYALIKKLEELPGSRFGEAMADLKSYEKNKKAKAEAPAEGDDR